MAGWHSNAQRDKVTPITGAPSSRTLYFASQEPSRMERVLTIVKHDPNENACDHTRHLTGDQRVSLLEDLRRRMSKVTHRAYPRRLRRVLVIARRAER
jgi:capsule polysaccharide export protein KpsC/LpsZ